MNRRYLETHAKALHLYRTVALPKAEASRILWGWVLPLYCMCLNEHGNQTGLRLPAFPEQKFCLQVWVDLVVIKLSTFHEVKRYIVSSRDVARDIHGNDGETRARKVVDRIAVKNFVLQQAQEHAYALPMFLNAANRTVLGPEESVQIFPPAFSV